MSVFILVLVLSYGHMVIRIRDESFLLPGGMPNGLAGYSLTQLHVNRNQIRDESFVLPGGMPKGLLATA